MKKTMILLLALSALSCGKWLDTLPGSEVDAKEMFETADGYYAAITGVYISMADSTLYGGRLPITLTEPLTRQYVLGDYTPGRNEWAAEYDYTGGQIETILSKVWGNMYNAIVNCNLFIDHARAERRTLFEDGVLSVMLGEALGLRACMYFDLARMFNESPAADPASANVPYKTDFGLMIGARLTTGQLLEKVVADLTEAQTLLLQHDPVVTGRTYRDKYVAWSRDRRMNYYAATALLARVHLYAGNYGDAFRCAMEVIDCNRYRFIRQDEIVVTDPYGKELKVDRMFMPELILGLETEDPAMISDTELEGYMGDMIGTLNCYDHSDIRRDAWHVFNPMMMYNMIKYQRSGLKGEQYKYGDPVAPVLRLGEMYIIAAEAALEEPSTGGDAVALLNELKTNRLTSTLAPNSTPEQVRREITREYICELRGEGQLFWYYKRMGMTAVDNGNYQGTTVDVPLSAYTFPVPQYEKDYGRAK